VDGRLTWVLTGQARQDELNRWCAAVGRPSYVPGDGDENATGWERLLVASWNMHGYQGELGRFLEDLVEGRLGAGDAVVVFLQEAPRVGGPVPAAPPPGSRWGKLMRGSESTGFRRDVVQQAREHGLNALYVPSMRNEWEAEDRGNAILTNLPLTGPVAVELPLLRDRRVAVSAEVPAPTVGRLRVTGLHLDHLAELHNLHRGFGSGRAEQVAALLEAIPDHQAGILAGDFNTWRAQESEEAMRLARDAYPSMVEIPEDPTVQAFAGLIGRRSDYVLARVPEGWTAEYRVVPDRYGSDHHPLVGIVHVPGGP
jgi:endonuclease/exonuclease/phosphatase family metal-dependent hydrolase